MNREVGGDCRRLHTPCGVNDHERVVLAYSTVNHEVGVGDDCRGVNGTTSRTGKSDSESRGRGCLSEDDSAHVDWLVGRECCRRLHALPSTGRMYVLSLTGYLG